MAVASNSYLHILEKGACTFITRTLSPCGRDGVRKWFPLHALARNRVDIVLHHVSAVLSLTKRPLAVLNGIVSSLYSPQANDTAEQRNSDDSEEAAMSNETDYAYDDDLAGNATLTSSSAASDPHCPDVASSSLNASSAETLPCWQVRN